MVPCICALFLFLFYKLFVSPSSLFVTKKYQTIKSKNIVLNTQNRESSFSIIELHVPSLYFYNEKLTKLQVYYQNRENRNCINNGRKRKKKIKDILARRHKVNHLPFERINLWSVQYKVHTIDSGFRILYRHEQKLFEFFIVLYAQREIDACSIALFGLIRSGFVRSIRY